MKFKICHILILFFLCTMLAACKDIKEPDQFARKFIDQMIQGDIDQCYSALARNIKNEKTIPVIRNVNKYLSNRKLISVNRVAFSMNEKMFENQTGSLV